MATISVKIRPDSNGTTNWANGAFDLIDEVVSDPDAGGADVAFADATEANLTETWGLSNPVGQAGYTTVTTASMKARVKSSISAVGAYITIDGNQQATKTYTLDNTISWETLTWTGSWPIASFDSATASVIAPNLSGNDLLIIDVLYLDLALAPAELVEFTGYIDRQHDETAYIDRQLDLTGYIDRQRDFTAER